MNLALILNPDAGTLRGLDARQAAEALGGIFRAHGHSVRTELHRGRAAIEAIARICAERECDAIVVGGGDGTVSAAAAAAAEHGVALGVLPLGTMNLFARSLRIPLAMQEAAEALAGGSVAAVDIGEVNGRRFIHHVTLGLHPRMIRIRERLSYSSRIGKILAGLQAWWMVLRRPPRSAVRMQADDQTLLRRATAILVSNNPLGEGHLPYADDLEGGKLGLYVTGSRRWGELLQLAARLTLGDIAENPALEKWYARSIELNLSKPRSNASVDGEIVPLETPIRFRIVPRGLKVLQPRTDSRPEGLFRG
jgi:diacylglycerol kinase family enzyme